MEVVKHYATKAWHFTRTSLGGKYLLTILRLTVGFLLASIFSCFADGLFNLPTVTTIVFMIYSTVMLLWFQYYSLQVYDDKWLKKLFVFHIIASIVFVSVFYAIIYYNLYRLHPDWFQTVSHGNLCGFDFFYLSLLTLCSGGCGDISITTTFLRIMAAMQTITGIAILVVGVANVDYIIKHVQEDRLKHKFEHLLELMKKNEHNQL